MITADAAVTLNYRNLDYTHSQLQLSITAPVTGNDSICRLYSAGQNKPQISPGPNHSEVMIKTDCADPETVGSRSNSGSNKECCRQQSSVALVYKQGKITLDTKSGLTARIKLNV